MDSIIGLLIGLLEAGLALWFLIELISNTCFYTQIDAIYKINLHISEFFCILAPVFVSMHSKGAHIYTRADKL